MRRLSALFGMTLALLGLLLLVEQAGWIIGAVGRFFWPLLLAAVVLMLVGSSRRSSARPVAPTPQAAQPAGELLAIPLAGALKADVTISAPLGRLSVTVDEAGPDALTGRCRAPIAADARLDGSTLVATLAPAEETPAARVDWDIALQPDLPLKLHITTGSGRAMLDLSGLTVISLALTTGVGPCDVRLPQQEGQIELHLNSGTGGVQIHALPATAFAISGVTDRLLTNLDTMPVPNPDAPRQLRLHIASATGAVRLLLPAG